MSGTDGWETPGAVLNGDFYLGPLKIVEYMRS